MPIIEHDKTGQLRSIDDIEKALKAVEKEFAVFRLPPDFFIELPVIRESLIEYLAFRKLAKEKKVKP